MDILEGKVREKKLKHGIRRLMERFGLQISDADYENFVYEIEEYINKPILVEDDGKSFHFIEIDGTQLVALYDWEFKTLLTFYYPKWFTQLPNGSWVKRDYKLNAKQRRVKQRAFDMYKKLGVVHTWD